MVRLIMSGKGEGKTKQLMELMNTAAETETGCMVCIEASHNISFNLRHQTRMIDAAEYQLHDFDTLRGFISGLYAGNYDITHIFIDSLTKIVGGDCNLETEKFLDWLSSFSDKHNIKFTVTISDDASLATEGIRKYF